MNFVLQLLTAGFAGLTLIVLCLWRVWNHFMSVAHADVSSQATEEEESNQEDDTIFRRYQRQEQERRQLRRAMIYAGQELPSDQLGWSIFSLLITPYIGVVALIFSGLSIKSRIQGNIHEAEAYAKVAAKLNLAACIIFGVSILILAWAFNEMEKEIQQERYRRIMVEVYAQYQQQLLTMQRQAYGHNHRHVNNYGRFHY